MNTRHEVDGILGEAVRASHAAVMQLEKFREQLHEALVARDLGEAADPATIGALYVEHVRCCWGETLDELARRRVRELRSTDTRAPF
jgi:hypothetical protein